MPPVGPGAMPLTQTPKAPHSSARLLVRLSTAALAADACAYGPQANLTACLRLAGQFASMQSALSNFELCSVYETRALASHLLDAEDMMCLPRLQAGAHLDDSKSN